LEAAGLGDIREEAIVGGVYPARENRPLDFITGLVVSTPILTIKGQKNRENGIDGLTESWVNSISSKTSRTNKVSATANDGNQGHGR
jgi:hypothetical protein